jgi:hypothetical protein
MVKSSSSPPSKRVTAADSDAAAGESNRSAPKARASYKQSDADREFISIIAAAMKVDLGGTTTWAYWPWPNSQWMVLSHYLLQ